MGSMAGKSLPEVDGNNSSSSSSNNSKNSRLVRRAHHAGSWYDSDATELQCRLQGFVQAAANAAAAANDKDNNAPSFNFSTMSLRAILCPHAGYSYSGPTAGYSYHALVQELLQQQQQQQQSHSCSPIRKILVLHPSHHVSLRKCAVSSAHRLETPLGALHVDDELRTQILNLSSQYFTTMSLSDDEHEHSGEMQYPFIAYCLAEHQKHHNHHHHHHDDDDHHHHRTGITVTPLMCGSLTAADEIAVGALLADIIARPDILTIVSTDFCHWGSRFRYQPTSDDTNKTVRSVFQFIEQLDRRGMDEIEAQRPGAFAAYLQETRNTICGRHAVAVWLRAISTNASKGQRQNQETASTNDDSIGSATASHNNDLSIRFVKYAQSSSARSMSDSSVSYAAALAAVPRTKIVDDDDESKISVPNTVPVT